MPWRPTSVSWCAEQSGSQTAHRSSTDTVVAVVAAQAESTLAVLVGIPGVETLHCRAMTSPLVAQVPAVGRVLIRWRRIPDSRMRPPEPRNRPPHLGTGTRGGPPRTHR
jgi:hypothetical protein